MTFKYQRISYFLFITYLQGQLTLNGARMEKMPSTMVIHKYVDEADTIFTTMVLPLAKKSFGEMSWSDQNRDLLSII